MLQLTTVIVRRSFVASSFIKSKAPQLPLAISNIRCLAQKVDEIPFGLPPNLGQRSDSKKISPLGWFLLILPATAFGLGCWQVKRKVWKENLIKELAEKTHAEPVELPENLDELNKMEYRLVKVRGEFHHDKEIYIGPRSLIRPDGVELGGGLISNRGNTNGYLVITPLKLSDREDTILVNRGWVPKKLVKPATRQEGQIPGQVELTGVVRLGENRPQFTPDHKGGVYLYRDLPRMCAETGASPYIIDADYSSSIPFGPVGGQTRVTLRNEHLSYVLTWFSLSAATSLLWYRQIIRRKAF